MLNPSAFKIPDDAREALVRSLMSTGVDRTGATEAVDLAAHAAEKGIAEVLSTVALGSRGGVRLCALQIAVQLLAGQCNRIGESMLEASDKFGYPRGGVAVQL